ncbi:RepA leader peptide Tap, partial [Escherichia coli]|nr:RepA leader peptide Tap [Escherichia coli]
MLGKVQDFFLCSLL